MMMTLKRQPRSDAWTSEEDGILTNIVLKTIEEGKPQIEAFEQAERTLSMRTKSACGYRWNNTLRQTERVKRLIEEAKGKGKEMKRERREGERVNRQPIKAEQSKVTIPKEVYPELKQVVEKGFGYDLKFIQRNAPKLNRFIFDPEGAKKYFKGLEVGFTPEMTPEQWVATLYNSSDNGEYKNGIYAVLNAFDMTEILNEGDANIAKQD